MNFEPSVKKNEIIWKSRNKICCCCCCCCCCIKRSASYRLIIGIVHHRFLLLLLLLLTVSTQVLAKSLIFPVLLVDVVCPPSIFIPVNFHHSGRVCQPVIEPLILRFQRLYRIFQAGNFSLQLLNATFFTGATAAGGLAVGVTTVVWHVVLFKKRLTRIKMMMMMMMIRFGIPRWDCWIKTQLPAL